MLDEYDIGESPYEEQCAQVGSPDYQARARLELKHFKRMMETLHPVPEDVKGWYKVKANPHDFGTYYSLAAVFDYDYEESEEWAAQAENKVPEYWDEEARLALAQYSADKFHEENPQWRDR